MNNTDYKVSTESDEVAKRKAEIEAIELEPEEIKYALFAGKSHKWHRERNQIYWQGKEKKK